MGTNSWARWTTRWVLEAGSIQQFDFDPNFTTPPIAFVPSHLHIPSYLNDRYRHVAISPYRYIADV
jgi:hypothetical protein